MKEKWTVIGGGFKGIIAASMLARKGKEVSIVEATNSLGGVLNSVTWKDFILDKGCHLFTNDDDYSTSMMLEILGDEYEQVNVKYASVFNQQLTDGIALPDFSVLGDKVVRKMLYETLYASTCDEIMNQTLAERIDSRFGPTAGKYISGCMKKMYHTTPDQLEPETLDMGLFKRIHFLERPVAMLLKQIPELDSRIAASSDSDQMEFYREKVKKCDFRNFYPAGEGMLTFCKRAEAGLRDLGVMIRMGVPVNRISRDKSPEIILDDGNSLKSDRIYWASDNKLLDKILGTRSGIADFIHEVPMVIFYFFINKQDAGEYTYIHDFDENDYIFRASVPGNYVENTPCPEGKTYICCEIPASVDSDIWKNKEKYSDVIWEELTKHNVAKGKPLGHISVNIPATYKVPGKGYRKAIDEIGSAIGGNTWFTGFEVSEFAKNDIVNRLSSLINEHA